MERDLVMQTEFNMTDAANLAGVSRRTFYNHIESKPITTKRNDSDEKVVDLSELKRVYGDETVLRNLQKMQSDDTVQERATAQGEGVQSVQIAGKVEIERLQAQIDALQNEKRLVEGKAEQIEEERNFLRERLTEAQEGQKRMTLLLENKSKDTEGTSDWQKSVKALESRIANQEKAEKERQEREQKLLDENKRIKQAYSRQKKELEAEKSKGLFKKLFG